MKVVYLDTNLYIALIKHNDPNYELIQKIIKQSHLSFVTSTATLVELSSVISREFNDLNLDEMKFGTLKSESSASLEVGLLLIDYLLTKTKTTIIQDPQIEILKYFTQEFMINPIYKIAILESFKIRLRTLDLLHFAASYHCNTIQGTKIDYVLSGDKEFISKGRSYEDFKVLTFIEPETLVKLECQ